MQYKKSFLIKEDYKDNTDFEKFLLYKIIYPIVNRIGLNRKFNLLRHKYGFYAENANGLCQWCGENHRIKPIREYKEKYRALKDIKKDTWGFVELITNTENKK
jgi:hypothetical protein